MLGKHGVGIEHAAARRARLRRPRPALRGTDRAARPDRPPAALRLPSVTSKRDAADCRRARALPSLTRPPSRKRVPGTTCFSATSLGELKEHDGVAKRVEHQRDRDREHAEPAADQNADAAACVSLRWSPPHHRGSRQPSSPRSLARSSICLIRPADPPAPAARRRLRLWPCRDRQAPHRRAPAATSLDIAAVGMQPIGKPLHHAADHSGALPSSYCPPRRCRRRSARRRWRAPYRRRPVGVAAVHARSASRTNPPRRAGRRRPRAWRAISPRPRRDCRPARRQGRGNSAPSARAGRARPRVRMSAWRRRSRRRSAAATSASPRSASRVAVSPLSAIDCRRALTASSKRPRRR